jgi:hypothetical protein
MKRPRRLLLSFAATLSIALPSPAAHPPKAAKTAAGRYSVSIAEFSSPPKIDGVLENPFWEEGTVIEDFTQFEPLEGGAPSEKTRAYIAYDRDNLYFAFRCYDSNPKAVRACLTPRDKAEQDDAVTIYLDTFNDKKRAFVFQVNPCGIQVDGVFTESGGRRRGGGRGSGGFERFDRNWDTYFLADARMDDEGYTIEMAIPFKSLRFPNVENQSWGIKIMRSIRRRNEEIYWPPHTRDVNGFLVQTGTLEFHGAVAKGKNIEIMPVATGLQQSGQKFDPQAGLNFKWGITSDMTFDSTLNPDFSQIEADMPQNDVNQRYALYYPEKRPFFLEGKDYFDTPFELVYSRTIVDPQWGFKLTGKTKGFTVGVLSAMDLSSPEISLVEPEEDEDDDGVDETFYRSLVNVFRLKKDLFSESSIGVIATDMEQGISGSSWTGRSNRVAGVDGHFKFLRYNRFSFQFLGSSTKTAEETTGLVPAFTLNLSHISRHLQLSADYSSVPPDFEASLGYFRRKDIHYLRTRASYTFLPQNDLIVSIRPSVEYRRNYDFAGILTDDEYSVSCFLTGWRQTYLWGSFTSGLERYNEVDFHQKDLMIGLGTEPLSWLSGNVRYSFGDGIYYDENPYLGYKMGLEMEIIFRPFPNLGLLYNFANDTFYKEKSGEKVYDINIISQRINYQISRPLSVRLITDYNNYYKELYVSLLLGYQHNSGTVFYIGVDDNRARDEGGVFRGTGRYYFIKFAYWWRL